MSSFFDKAKKLGQTIGVSKDSSINNSKNNEQENIESQNSEKVNMVEEQQIIEQLQENDIVSIEQNEINNSTNNHLEKVQEVANLGMGKLQSVAELSKVKIKGVANLGRETVEDVGEFAWNKVQNVAGKGLDSINQAIGETMKDLQGLRPILSKCGFSIEEIEIEFSIPPEFQVSIVQPKNATEKLEEAIKDVKLTKTQQIFVSSLRAVNLANDFIIEKYSDHIEDITVIAGFPPKLKVKLK